MDFWMEGWLKQIYYIWNETAWSAGVVMVWIFLKVSFLFLLAICLFWIEKQLSSCFLAWVDGAEICGGRGGEKVIYFTVIFT